MFNFILIGLLIASFALSNIKPRKAVVFYFIMALIVLFFKIIPGTFNIFDYVIMALLLISSGFFFLITEMTEKNRTIRTYMQSLTATFKKRKQERKL